MPGTNPNGGVPETSASTAPSEVSEASQSTETTKATDPMATAPAEPTAAQQDESGVLENKPSEEALRQVREDAAWRADNPNKVLIREANPEVGGEDNSYLDHVSG